MNDFYDQLSSLYHLIFLDWQASINKQGLQLSEIIEAEWPKSKKMLDVSCGIGTQAIALTQNNYLVRASDLSSQSINRAKDESKKRKLMIDYYVNDMRNTFEFHGTGFDVVLSADNSIPHLLNDSEILDTFKQFYQCLKQGGGVLLTVRDYQNEERGKNIFKPYGIRIEGQKRFVIYQIWDFMGDIYELSFFFIEEDLVTNEIRTHVMHSRYYAISIVKLCDLLQKAGFKKVRRIDNIFYQPVLVGTK